MKAVAVRDWDALYYEWTGLNESVIAPELNRDEVLLLGQIREKHGTLHEFSIGRARDPFGTSLFLKPALTHPFLTQADGGNDREWLHMWAQVAVHSGYLEPSVDPSVYADLAEIRRRNERLEFIVDTNVPVSGVGRWLVRWFGDSADFIRTVVTDLELQNWADKNNLRVNGFETLRIRQNYLSACRFLESLGDGRPLWRRLDIVEESALIGPVGHRAGADVLLLRAVRRQVLDVVPRLRRFFVTTDWKLARAATHDLPAASVLAVYVNPIPKEGAYLGSLQWWPSENADRGHGHLSGIPAFAAAALDLCDFVTIKRADGRWIRISGYEPSENQFPSSWEDRQIWWEAGSAAPPASPASAIMVAPGSTPPVTDIASPAVQRETSTPPCDWPLRNDALPVPNRCAARISLPYLFEVLTLVMRAVAQDRAIPARAWTASSGTVRETKTFLRAAKILSPEGVEPGELASKLPELFARNDLDGLSHLLAGASNYQDVLVRLREHSPIRMAALDDIGRSSTSLVGLVRQLGQAVEINGQTYDGSGYVDPLHFKRWLLDKIDEVAKLSPLGEAPLAALAESALLQLKLSPVRFERAFAKLLEETLLPPLEFGAGGTPDNLIAEEVLFLSEEGFRRETFTADKILGFRTVQRK